MKTIWNSRELASIFLFSILAFTLACGHQGGMSAEQISAETDAALKKQENKSIGIERLQQELAQVPTTEKLTKEPYRDTLGPYILERQGNGQYEFYSPPVEDLTTGEFRPANTMISALVEYKKVDDGPYLVPEKKITIPGYRLDAEVTLIDHTIPAVIHRKTFKGAPPKPSLVSSNKIYVNEGAKEVVGEKPLEEIVSWTRGLPLRK